MFINVRLITSHKHDTNGNVLVKTQQTIYLFDGQEANEKTLHPEVQAYYKKLYGIQEEAGLLKERPVSIFEALGIGFDLPIKASTK